MANKKSPKKKTTAKKKTTTKKTTTKKTTTAVKKKTIAAKKTSPKKVVKENERKVKPLVEEVKKPLKEVEETKKEPQKAPREVKHSKAIAANSMKAESKKKARERLFTSNTTNADSEMVKKLITITAAVLTLLITVYFIASFVRGDLKKKADEEIKVIQNNEILASRIFDKPDNEYYVVVYEIDSKDNEFIKNLVADYRNKKELPIFEVDLANMLNKDIVSDKEAVYIKEGFKVKSSTMLRIKDKEIAEHIDTDRAIIDLLKSKIIKKAE